MKKKIEEIIIVEGKDDIAAVKRAVDAEIFQVQGFSGLKKSTLNRVKAIAKKKDIIILTDPDFAGEKIRRAIEEAVPTAKHAYISREEGTKKDNIGVENASPEDIVSALEMARCKERTSEDIYTMTDLVDAGLSVGSESKALRQALGAELKIGYANSKQLLSKLNNFGISKEDFLRALEVARKKVRG